MYLAHVNKNHVHGPLLCWQACPPLLVKTLILYWLIATSTPLLLSYTWAAQNALKSHTVITLKLVVLIHSLTLCLEMTRSSDQHKSVDQGVCSLPNKYPLVSKSCFHVHIPDGPSVEFAMHAYQLPPNRSSITLLHSIWKKKMQFTFPMEI